MIIVLLLFFQSICLYCQRLVLHIHDRWINPKNVRILKEATETVGERKALAEFNARTSADASTQKRTKKTTTTTFTSVLCSGDDALAEVESCRFCANSPQGYCRHHFHLQELQVQKQQQKRQQQLSRIWNPLCSNAEQQQKQEYRQLRRINRELKRNLKNRLSTQQQQQPYQQYQAYKCYLRETAVGATDFIRPTKDQVVDLNTPTTPSADTEHSIAISSNSSGYQSGCTGEDITPISACTTYYFDAGEGQTSSERQPSLDTDTSSILTTHL